jgi:DNA-binding LytR/AlgR family response regulator
MRPREAGRYAHDSAGPLRKNTANGTERRALTVLAVDDERPALDDLVHLLGEQDGVRRVDRAGDATAALRLLRNGAYDVAFLDIRMPGLDGMELARLLRQFAEPPAIVFVTAFEAYAVEAFEVRAADYLLKPVAADRLAEALTTVRARRLGETHRDDADDLATVPVELGGRTLLVNREDVCWAEANGDYVRLHTVRGQHHLVRLPLSVLAERWAGAGFVRVHRGHLVALRHISEIRSHGSGYLVRVAGRDLPVSRRHSRELRERLVRGARRTEDRP